MLIEYKSVDNIIHKQIYLDLFLHYGEYFRQVSKIIDNEEITIRAFEKKIGCSNGLISRFIKNGQREDEEMRTDINGKWLSIIIETFPWYNAEWLLTGKGNMLSESGTANQKEIKKESIISDVADKFTAPSGPCEKCKMKDELISSLKREVETLSKYNSILESK